MTVEIDILEDSIFQLLPKLLNTLLKDHTASKADIQHNIFWLLQIMNILTKNANTILLFSPNLITGDNGHIIMPRVFKSRDTLSTRSRDMAEVFTSAYIMQYAEQPD